MKELANIDFFSKLSDSSCGTIVWNGFIQQKQPTAADLKNTIDESFRTQIKTTVGTLYSFQKLLGAVQHLINRKAHSQMVDHLQNMSTELHEIASIVKSLRSTTRG